MFETELRLPDIPQASPRGFFDEHKDEIMAAMARVLDSGAYVLGAEVKAFEEEFARQFGYGYAVGVANGTDALALALRCLGVGQGDRVATVSHTAIATVAAIEMAGASPVFVDIRPDTYTMDPDALVHIFETTDVVKAVIVVHLYGHPASIPAIHKIASRFGARVVEDCAQSHGAALDGQFVGSTADAATFSFYPTKNLGALGDGGMVVTNDPERAAKLKILREYGWERRYVSACPGVNSRLDELQAAFLRVRLPWLQAGNRRRAEIAAMYDEAFWNTGLVLPVKDRGATHVYHQYVVRHPGRDLLREQLRRKGVLTGIHYPAPAHLQPAYSERFAIAPGLLATTESISGEILSLPMYPELRDAEVARVVDAVVASL